MASNIVIAIYLACTWANLICVTKSNLVGSPISLFNMRKDDSSVKIVNGPISVPIKLAFENGSIHSGHKILTCFKPLFDIHGEEHPMVRGEKHGNCIGTVAFIKTLKCIHQYEKSGSVKRVPIITSQRSHVENSLFPHKCFNQTTVYQKFLELSVRSSQPLQKSMVPAPALVTNAGILESLSDIKDWIAQMISGGLNLPPEVIEALQGAGLIWCIYVCIDDYYPDRQWMLAGCTAACFLIVVVKCNDHFLFYGKIFVHSTIPAYLNYSHDADPYN